MKKTINNIIFNALYQLFLIAIPIVSVPYLARTLGAKELGVNSFVLSIASFLGIIIFSGMNQLGAREIAREEDRIKAFWKLWSSQLAIGLVITVIFSISILFINENKIYFLIEIPLLLSSIFDISWFFLGIGEVRKVVTRNTIIKVSSLLLIFIFVKNDGDLWIYMLINSLMMLLSVSVFWISLNGMDKRYFKEMKLSIDARYFKTTMFLLIPQVAVQIYTNLDKTLVGFLSNSLELSYYDQSQKIARIILSLVTSIALVLMPIMARIENSEDGEKEKKLNQIFKLSLDYTLVSCLFFSLLLMVNTSEFVPWFFGNQFLDMKSNMYWVSLIIIFIGYGSVYSNQYSLAKGMYKELAIPYILGAIISVTLNLLIVPRYASTGATFTILFTEFSVCLLRIFLIRNKVKLGDMFREQYKYVISFLSCLITANFIPINMGSLLVDMAIRTVIISFMFIFLLIIFRTRFINDIKKIINK